MTMAHLAPRDWQGILAGVVAPYRWDVSTWTRAPRCGRCGVRGPRSMVVIRAHDALGRAVVYLRWLCGRGCAEAFAASVSGSVEACREKGEVKP